MAIATDGLTATTGTHVCYGDFVSAYPRFFDTLALSELALTMDVSTSTMHHRLNRLDEKNVIEIQMIKEGRTRKKLVFPILSEEE